MDPRLSLIIVIAAVAGLIGYFVSVGLAALFLILAFLAWLLAGARGRV